MKKLLKSIVVITITLVIAISMSYFDRGYVLADINGAEASVIGAASSTFYYQGSYYRVKSTYINQLINALDTQYDLTSSQASSCVSFIYNNIAAGISGGYLYEVEMEETEPYEDAPDVDDSFVEEVPDIPDDEINDSEAGNTDNVVNLDEMGKTTRSKEEIINDATSLAADMGMNISYDSRKNGITITDKSGNVLISMKSAVKNTGFRLNTLVIFPACLIIAVVLILIISWRLKLFSYEKTDE